MSHGFNAISRPKATVTVQYNEPAISLAYPRYSTSVIVAAMCHSWPSREVTWQQVPASHWSMPAGGMLPG